MTEFFDLLGPIGLDRIDVKYACMPSDANGSLITFAKPINGNSTYALAA